ncbi:acyl carrier protein [Roseibium litorale]|uniref:Acyl carrier protein n=1 Tax=Roseibium litorale TaxID=2803841 RepID=A0ABR9CNH2_9HYPH|nr:acyl carrier protein [Roseibium litorale]MBD8892433.1 acyl carrier protein [Roseibium litorale]
MNDTIRELLSKHGGLPVAADQLADTADLYEAGLSSFASVQLMLALEEEFDIEFPEAYLNRKTFSSISAIAEALADITKDRQVA